MSIMRVKHLGKAKVPLKKLGKKYQMVDITLLDGNGAIRGRFAVEDLKKALKGTKGVEITVSESFEQAGFE